ncbi:hypothetical protein [Devosia pacifica]|uniref:hypothetical protein n=1 Tax=Devosia pacifica TaxID=1335967 RepID=UPI001672B212|nr:hypothetical protein [Devosia pacifica]
MRVEEVVARLNEFPQANQQAFERAMADFRDERHIELVVPAYALENGDYLLLDGNHRVCALFALDASATVRLRTLVGPIDRRILIDLKHWDGGYKRFINRIRRGTSAGKAHQARRSP